MLADHLSRTFIDQNEWSLNPKYLKEIQSLGNVSHRSDGNGEEFPAPPLILPILASASPGPRCSLQTMELSSRLCIFSTPIDSQKLVENPSEGSGNSGATLLAQEAMVFVDMEDETVPPNSNTSLSRSSTAGRAPSSMPRETKIKGVEIERRSLKHLDLSDRVRSTLLQARKKTTNATYHRIWKAFVQFSTKRNWDSIFRSVSHILAFLQGCLDKGLA